MRRRRRRGGGEGEGTVSSAADTLGPLKSYIGRHTQCKLLSLLS